MKLSDYGPNTNVYELMTWLFPGVRFGEFHEKMDPEHFSETTGKCSLVKTRFWIEIENEFKKCSSKPSDFFDFIKYLSEYKASGEEIVFKQCFPYIDSSNSANSIFSCSILLNQLAPLNPLKKSDEIEQLIKDCDILNGKTLKGGLFLYCARILDSKFLSFFYGKGQNDEKFIYKLLKYYDSQIAANKTQFPVSSIFNESNRWGIDWEAQYVYDKNNRCKYRFSWQKDKDEHWQTLYEYKPYNPYQYFLHECQTRYTLVRIGYESTSSSSIKRAKDIKKFEQYSKKGLSEIFTKFKLLRNNGKNQESRIREFYEKSYHSDGFSKKDYEGNILIGIETKVGAENFTPAFFIPKDFEKTIREINYAVSHKKSEKETQHSEYKLNSADIKKLNKIFSKLPQEAFNNLSPKETVALQKKQPYELLKILNKPDVQNFLSEDEKKFSTECYNTFYTEESFDTSINNEESKDTLLDRTSNEDVRNNTYSKKSSKKKKDSVPSLSIEEITKAFNLLMDKFRATASEKLNEETIDAVIKSFNEEFFKDDKLGLKTDIASTDDENIWKHREEYYDDLLEAIKSIDFNTLPSELSDNIFAKRYLELDKNKPKKGIRPYEKQIRETIRDILLELQVSQKAPEFFDILKGKLLGNLQKELLKKTSLGKEKVTNYIDEIWKDFKNASNKAAFFASLQNDIINFDINCSDEELSDNYFIKKFLKSEISFPNTTVHIMFREILNGIIKNW